MSLWKLKRRTHMKNCAQSYLWWSSWVMNPVLTSHGKILIQEGIIFWPRSLFLINKRLIAQLASFQLRRRRGSTLTYSPEISSSAWGKLNGESERLGNRTQKVAGSIPAVLNDVSCTYFKSLWIRASAKWLNVYKKILNVKYPHADVGREPRSLRHWSRCG